MIGHHEKSVPFSQACKDLAYENIHSDIQIANRVIPGGRSALRHNPVELQIAAMRDAIEIGILGDGLSAQQLGQQIFASYNGALHFWTMGGLSADEFERLALHGLYSVLAAAATDETRPRFVGELRTLGHNLGGPR